LSKTCENIVFVVRSIRLIHFCEAHHVVKELLVPTSQFLVSVIYWLSLELFLSPFLNQVQTFHRLSALILVESDSSHDRHHLRSALAESYYALM
jgi:hypothetical protein